jgi:hypothetical protein
MGKTVSVVVLVGCKVFERLSVVLLKGRRYGRNKGEGSGERRRRR